MSAVYFARFGDYVKIGFASNPHKRLKEIAQAHDRLIYPDDFPRGNRGELVLVIPFCRQRDESNLHLLFARHWAIGEWFHWSPEFRHQMETMQFVTHEVRLKDLRGARKALGLVPNDGIGYKEAHFGKTALERVAESHLDGAA